MDPYLFAGSGQKQYDYLLIFYNFLFRQRDSTSVRALKFSDSAAVASERAVKMSMQPSDAEELTQAPVSSSQVSFC